MRFIKPGKTSGRALTGIVSGLPTIRELSHDGSNRNAEKSKKND
jgi:hypothetical protein